MEKYFLGIRKEDNRRVYMPKPSWDCGWYWGFGYIQTKHSLEHFDNLFLTNNVFDSFKDYFQSTPLSNEDIWTLLGYMEEFYIMKKYAELLQYGNHITSKAINMLEDKNKEDNQKETERINKILMKELFEKIDKLLTH